VAKSDTPALSALSQYLDHAQVPVQSIVQNPDGTFTVTYPPDVSDADRAKGDAVVAGFDGKGRTPKVLPAIFNEIKALTPGQQQTAWNLAHAMLGGQYAGAEGGALWALECVGAVHTQAAERAVVQNRHLALQCYDLPLLLYKPPEDPTINVEGWQPT
jgi:hypothetical protein